MRNLWPGIGCAVALLMALASCGTPLADGIPTPPPGTAPAPPVGATVTGRPTADPAAILAQLRRTATLAEAAGQCAAMLGVSPDQALIRIETPKEQDCVPCNRLPIGSLSRGVPVGEISLPLEPRSWVWVTVGDLLCVYLFDGQEFKPSSVTHW